MLKGQKQQGHRRPLGPARELQYNKQAWNRLDSYFSLRMTHCHSVCLPRPTIYPLQMLTDPVWVCTFGAILDSPFVLASVLSPSSPPFPLAHCELQRNENTSVIRAQAHANIGLYMKCFRDYRKGNKRAICIMWLIGFTLNWISFLKPKIVSITGCLMLLGMGIRGE